MLSTDHIQESMLKRIEQVVATLMAERPFFQEKLDYIEIVNHLAKVFQINLTIEEFTRLSDSDLKSRRYYAGVRNFFQLYQSLADTWRFYDNSDPTEPRIIATGGMTLNEIIYIPEIWKIIGGK